MVVVSYNYTGCPSGAASAGKKMGILFYRSTEVWGTFRVDWKGNSELSRREFMMLFEGVRPRTVSPRFRLKKNIETGKKYPENN